MKKSVRLAIFALVLVLLGSLILSPAAAGTDITANPASGEFTPLEKKSYDSIYTQIRIPGYDYPVFAFQSADGSTAFRIYGSYGKKTGYFPAEIIIKDPGTPEEHFTLALSDQAPAKNDKKRLAVLTTVPYPELPEGFEAIGKTGCAVRMVNIYGQEETYIYGTYDDPENPEAAYGWYESRKTRKINGSLKTSLENASRRKKPDGVKALNVPKELKNGFARDVEITCSNGLSATVSTDFPKIDYDSLEISIGLLQGEKIESAAVEKPAEAERKADSALPNDPEGLSDPDFTSGTFTELFSESLDVPYPTEYLDDETRYVDDPEITERNGIPGEKAVTWSITYTDGTETGRKKIAEAVLVDPVAQVVRRGTRQHTADSGTVTTVETIPVATEYVDNPDLYTDAPEKILREGSAGEKTVTWEITYYDGTETSRNPVSESVTKEMVTKQITRGTREHVITADNITVTEPIPYRTVREPWSSLQVGEEISTGAGENGEKQIMYRITYTDGQETSREKVSETVTREPVDEYIAYGTFEPSYSYEYIAVSLPGAHGENTLSGAASQHAMAMAQAHQVFHAGSGYTESVGGWDSAGAVGSGLMAHVPGLAACEFYGVGCVKCSVSRPDGTTSETYYGVAYGGGGILLDENGEVWY